MIFRLLFWLSPAYSFSLFPSVKKTVPDGSRAGSTFA